MSPYSHFTLFLAALVGIAVHVDAGDKASPQNTAQVHWIRHYAALTAPGRDEAQLITTDKLGNFYVAGTSERLSNPQQGILIKYDRVGRELWKNEYPVGQLLAISVDSQSNLYLLDRGYYAPGQLSKYDSDGNREWSIENQRIDKFVIDNNGNCLAASRTTESLGWYGPYFTRVVITKYSPEAAAVRSDTVFQDTTAASIDDFVIDANGNIIMTIGTYLMKLDSNAVPIWTVRDTLMCFQYILVDGGNNIYALTTTRQSNTIPQDSAYFLIKLLSDGRREWKYDFPEKIHNDQPLFKLQFDGQNNLYVVADAGSSLMIDKISPSGEFVWNSTIQTPDLRKWDCATGEAGNTFIGVSTWDSCRIVYLEPSGVVLWTKDLNEGKDIYHVSTLSGGLVADAYGNVTLACLQRENPNSNWCTVHMDKNGETLWETTYDYRGNTQDYVYDLALDHSGNVYVTGRSESFDTLFLSNPDASHSGHHWDFATVKYSPDGEEDWVARDNGDAHEGDYYRNLFLSVDLTGHATISGANLVTPNEYEAATIQYDGTGKKGWDSRYAVQHEFRVEGMVGDREGNIYITGTEYYWHVKYVDPDVTWTTIKYSPSGETLWMVHARDTSSSQNMLYQAEDIALDSLGNIVTAAMEHTRDGGSYSGIALRKYAQNGTLIWKTRLDDPYCELQDMEISRYSSIYVSVLVRQGYGLQYETMMFDSAGVLQWRSIFGGTCAIERPMTIDSEGGVCITGCGTANYNREGQLRWFLGNLEGGAITCDDENALYILWKNSVSKYSTSGRKEWEVLIPNTPDDKDFVGRRIKIDKDRNVIVTGTSTMSTSEGTGIVYTTVKLAQNATAVKENGPCVPGEFALYQNCPNPFNPQTVVSYQLPVVSNVKLVVYDMLGREVSVLVNDRIEAGVHEVKFDGSNLATGVYFYRLQAGDFIATRRLLLIK